MAQSGREGDSHVAKQIYAADTSATGAALVEGNAINMKSVRLSQHLGENAQQSRTSKELKGHGVLSSQSTL